MGPLGLAASSLGLASEIKMKTQHLNDFQTYFILSKPCEVNHTLYISINAKREIGFI